MSSVAIGNRNLSNEDMKIKKVGKKWIIKGDGEGWIFDRTFPTKWKAKLALEIFKKGGRVSDYFEAAEERRKRKEKRVPRKAIERVQKALNEIQELNPTSEEIEEYGEVALYGEVTYTDDKGYFGPRLHNTWGLKRGGRVHIDIGSGGVHLMLDKNTGWNFIEFIRNKRKSKS